MVDIFLAIILAILYKKPYNYFCKKFGKHKKKATFLTISLVFFTIIIPLTFIALMLSDEVSSTYNSFMGNWSAIEQYIEKLPEKAAAIPVLHKFVDDINIDKIVESANQSLSTIAQYVFGLIQKTFINVGFMIIHFFIILFLLYFIFIDGKILIKKIQFLVPLKDSEEQELINKLEKVTDAIVFNTFMLAILEGTFGGILFAILGIHSPFFWAIIMIFLSIIPVVGTNTILVPMGIFQIAIGNVWTGVIILVVGTGAVIINQNIIRPRLDGYKSDMHPAIMFLASMGGLISMGVVGFLAGPMIAGLFIVIWDIFGIRYKQKLEEYNRGE